MEQKRTTKNGVDIFSYKNEHLHGFYLSLFLKGGSMYENEKNSGITHFIEHLAIRNVNAHMNGELYRTLDRLGIEFNASTYNEMVQFYISGAKENFAVAVKILCTLFAPLILSREDIDIERARIKAEIREGDEGNLLANFTAEKLYRGTSLALPIMGCNRTVSAITLAQLKREREVLFARENIFFYLTGAFDEGDIDMLSSTVEGYDIRSASRRENIAPVPSDFGKRAGSVHIKNADYIMLRFCFDMDMTKISEAESDILYDILFTGYNSRFFVEMSEKRGLCYDITGSLERYLNIGTMYFNFEVKRADLEEAVRLSVEILRSMKNDLLDAEQIITAPYVDNAYLLFDDSRELNFTFAYDCHILSSPYHSLSDRRKTYARVTPERIREVAREMFTLDNCTLTLKGPKKKIDPDALHTILLLLDK